MATEYPSDGGQECLEECPEDCLEERLQECLNEPPFDDPEQPDDEPSDDMISLLEENARLRGLVLRLTEMILKNVGDRG